MRRGETHPFDFVRRAGRSPLRLWRTLGFRFAAVVMLVIAITVALLTVNGIRLLDAGLVRRENERLEEMRALINATIALHLSQNDLATARHEVQAIRSNSGLLYVVLLDRDQRILTAEGWPADRPLPAPVDRVDAIPPAGGRIDTYATVMRDGHVWGHVLFGVSTENLQRVRQQMVWQNLIIGLVAALLAGGATWLLGRLVTRELRALRAATAAVGSGETQTRLRVSRHDEIGELATAFNRMAGALDNRMEALVKSEARFHAIADFTYGVEAWFNPAGRLVWINRSIERVAGFTPVECVLAPDLFDLLVYPKDRRAVHEAFALAMQGKPTPNFEVRIQCKNGTTIWAGLNWQPIFGPDGEHLGLRVSGDDISSRKQAEIKLLDTVVELRREQSLKEYYLKRSEEERFRLAALLDVLQLGILFVGRDRRVVYTNRAFRRVWGFAETDDFDGMRDAVLMERMDGHLIDAGAFRLHVDTVVKSREVTRPFEFALRDGRTLADVSAVVSGPSPIMYLGRVWIFEDVTERNRVAAQLTHLAERDPLTGLYNRRRFHEELDRLVADAVRRRTELGVLVLDLDGFKPINDSYGHHAGDQVLVRIARELGSIVRRSEMFFRLGGDEFAVLAQDTSEFEMIGLARRVAAAIAELRFTFGGDRVSRITASLGIAIFPQHAENGEQLVTHADSAMYQAKSAGKNHWRIYRDASRAS